MTKRGKTKTLEKITSDESGECVNSSSAGPVVEDAKHEVDEQYTDDDSPINISWKDSKEVFKQGEKKRKEAVDFVRSKEKEKRRKKNEMFVSQKRRKTDKRTDELTKLPQHIVLAVTKKPKVDTNNTRKEKPLVKKRKPEEKLPKKRKRTDKREDRLKKQEHYKVLVVKDEVKKPKKVQDSAVKFLENHLYGNRIYRVSPSSNLTSQCKSFGVMKPALKFKSKA